MPWSSSQRHAELPADWAQRRAKVKARANGQCEHVKPGGTRCTNQGTECHHLGDKLDHRLTQLQWICADCHRHETQRQARDAQQQRHAARKRPAERHPGRLTPTL